MAPSINSVEVGDFDLEGGGPTIVCCVTAQQERHSDYRTCSSPTIGVPLTAIIGGASAGAAVAAVGIITGFILAIVCCVKKRYTM